MMHRASKVAPDLREAVCYRNSITPWGRRYIGEWVEDEFNAMLPGEIYNRYFSIREVYAKEARDLLTRTLEGLEWLTPSGVT